MIKMQKDFITLAEGSGGKEMQELIKSFGFCKRGNWKECDNDSAVLDLDAVKGKGKPGKLVFTTDSFIVNPIFFPGGDIGHLAFSGTINDLVVMGAKPLGISLGFVIEEGFSKEDLDKIITSIKKLSEEYDVSVVTGDTKVMENGKLDKIIINTSGLGIVDEKDLLTKKIIPGDKVIISGGIGEHAVALLSKRFEYETKIITDSKPLIKEMDAVKRLIKIAKDPTRGGIASILNEICSKNKVGMLVSEEEIPAKQEVRKVVEMLGINLYELACEGRMICVADKNSASKVVKLLKEFNPDASIIGEIVDDAKDNHVVLQTMLGKRILAMPTGRIVPRIC
ncbi:hydrogenase expression/formation protein HypE [Candidatus Woesearchaeota archaeon]|nr:hydrogenase expression/formation protein HypE [Candidatus Woesearchaeota archaeon]